TGRRRGDLDVRRDRRRDRATREAVEVDREPGIGGCGADREQRAGAPAVRRGGVRSAQQARQTQLVEQLLIDVGLAELDAGLLDQISTAVAPGRRIERM